MTFAGKKLQDIYDSGSARLNELEESATARLAGKASSHVNERQQSEQQSKMEVAAKAAAVEEEIKRQARQATERMNLAAQKERANTEAYLSQLAGRLSQFQNDLKRAIENLKTAHQSSLDDSFMRASDHYSSVVEGAAVELETQHYTSGQRLRSQASFFANSLQQKLDHSVWEQRGSEKQSNSTLFRNYMQKANSIESHFSNLMQRFSGDFQTEFEKLENYARASEATMGKDSEVFSARIDAILSEIEREVNNVFTAASDANKMGLQDNFAGVCEGIEAHAVETAASLKEETKAATTKLTKASMASNLALKRKCDEVKEAVAADMESFKERIDTQLAESELVKRELEEAKARVIGEIRSELVNIRSTFEEHLQSLMRDAVASLTNLGREVDGEMEGAYERSLSKIGADSLAAKTEIAEATNKLLKLIAEQKAQALKEIAKAAGENQ